MKTFLWYDLQKKQEGLYVFFANSVRQFLKSSNIGRHFRPDLQGFCSDFQGFSLNF